jgi:uncharacterized protein
VGTNEAAECLSDFERVNSAYMQGLDSLADVSVIEVQQVSSCAFGLGLLGRPHIAIARHTVTPGGACSR